MAAPMKLEDVTARMLAEIEDQAVKAALEEVAASQGDAIRRVQEIIGEATALKNAAAQDRLSAQSLIGEAIALSEAARQAEVTMRASHENAERVVADMQANIAAMQEQVNAERALRERSDSEVSSLRALCTALEAKLSQPQQVIQPATPINVTIPVLEVVRGPEGRIREIVPRK